MLPMVARGHAIGLMEVVDTEDRNFDRHDVDAWYTIPDPRAGDRLASQRWHRDGWEDHIVKVFSEFVDPGSGSLMLQLLVAGLLSGTFFLKSTVLYLRTLVTKAAR